MPKIGGFLVALRPNGTRSGYSHRTRWTLLLFTVTLLHDASHRYSLVAGVPGRMRGGVPAHLRALGSSRWPPGPFDAHVNPPGGGSAGPPPNGGNGVTRGTTRRRHTANQLLMLQNPHRSQPRAPRRLQDLGAGPIGAKKLAPHGPFSSISAKKFAQQA